MKHFRLKIEKTFSKSKRVAFNFDEFVREARFLPRRAARLSARGRRRLDLRQCAQSFAALERTRVARAATQTLAGAKRQSEFFSREFFKKDKSS